MVHVEQMAKVIKDDDNDLISGLSKEELEELNEDFNDDDVSIYRYCYDIMICYGFKIKTSYITT